MDSRRENPYLGCSISSLLTIWFSVIGHYLFHKAISPSPLSLMPHLEWKYCSFVRHFRIYRLTKTWRAQKIMQIGSRVGPLHYNRHHQCSYSVHNVLRLVSYAVKWNSHREFVTLEWLMTQKWVLVDFGWLDGDWTENPTSVQSVSNACPRTVQKMVM